VGDSPFVYCRTVRAPIQYEKESFQGILQIVPVSEEKYGTPIKFENMKCVTLRLRHLLTGRYLMIGLPDEKCVLSDTLYEYLSMNMAPIDLPSLHDNLEHVTPRQNLNPAIRTLGKGKLSVFQLQGQQIIQDRKSGIIKPELANNPSSSLNVLLDKIRPNIMEGIRKQSTAVKLPPMLEGQRSLSSNLNFIPRLDMSVEREQSLYQNLENMPELQLKEEEAPKEPIKQFVERTKIVLRNATQDDEDVLTTVSVFSLESLYEGVGYLSVKLFHKDDKADKDAFKCADGPSHKYHGEALKFFHARFHKKNPFEKKKKKI